MRPFFSNCGFPPGGFSPSDDEASISHSTNGGPDDRIGMEHHNHEKYGAREPNDDVRKKISKMEVFLTVKINLSFYIGLISIQSVRIDLQCNSVKL